MRRIQPISQTRRDWNDSLILIVRQGHEYMNGADRWILRRQVRTGQETTKNERNNY